MFNVGFKYGLVGHNNYDFDLLWVAQAALVDAMGENPDLPVKQIIKKYGL